MVERVVSRVDVVEMSLARQFRADILKSHIFPS